MEHVFNTDQNLVDAAAFAVESTGLARVLVQMREALLVMAGHEGYEDMTMEERIAIGERALRMVPENIDVRLQGSTDLEEPLRFGRHLPVALLGFSDAIMAALEVADIHFLRDVEQISDERLMACSGEKGDIIPATDLAVLRRLVPSKA